MPIAAQPSRNGIGQVWFILDNEQAHFTPTLWVDG